MGRLLRVLALVGAASGCNVGSDLSDCDVDSQCAPAERCHPEGKFCEIDTRPIRIGATLALTGELRAPAESMETALRLAVETIEDDGGVLGRPVELLVLDDAGEDELARENVQRLIGAGVVGIVGPMKSAQAVATAPLTHEARVLQISPSAGTPCLDWIAPERDRYFFRTISTMRTGSGAAIALYARERPDGGAACDRMAILHSEDETGLAFLEAVESLFESAGGTVGLVESFPAGAVLDYERQVDALVADRPDCAVMVGWPDAGAALLRQFATTVATDTSRDWSTFLWIGTTALRSDRFLELSREDPLAPTPSYAEGFHGADTDSTPMTVHYQMFRDLYNARFGRPEGQDAPQLAANAFDAAILIALAVESAGTARDRMRVRDGLWSVVDVGADHTVIGPGMIGEALARVRRGGLVHYHGASSALVFDARGTVSNPTLIWRVRDGAIETAHRYDEEDTAAIVAGAPERTVAPDFCAL